MLSINSTEEEYKHHLMLSPWNILKSTVSYHDRWLHVRTDTCQTAQGTIIDSWHVIEYPAWTNTVALTPTGQIVLVKEYRHGAGTVLFGLPGGSTETSDHDMLTAAQRELGEETGYHSPSLIEVGRTYPNPANQNNLHYSFLALDAQPSHTQLLDEEEHIEIVLFDFVSFLHDAWSGMIPLQALHLTALGFATHFLLTHDLPSLAHIRTRLQQCP